MAFLRRTIATTLPAHRVLELVSRSIGPKLEARELDRTGDWIRDELAARPLTGQLWHDGFELSSRDPGRHSFRPTIVGKIEASPDGTRVELGVRLNPFGLVVVGLLGLSFAEDVGRCVAASGLRFGAHCGGSLAALAFLLALPWAGTLLEAKSVERLLRARLLERSDGE